MKKLRFKVHKTILIWDESWVMSKIMYPHRRISAKKLSWFEHTLGIILTPSIFFIWKLNPNFLNVHFKIVVRFKIYKI